MMADDTLRPSGFECRMSEMESRIDRLEHERDEMKLQQDRDCTLKIADIVAQIGLYQPTIQISMYNMLRSLIADRDNNWIEKIKANQERISAAENTSNEPASKKALCLGVVTELILILLKRANIASYADNTKMAALISLITDYSKEKIRQRLSDGSPLPKRHQAEIDAVNKALENIGIEERISAAI